MGFVSGIDVLDQNCQKMNKDSNLKQNFDILHAGSSFSASTYCGRNTQVSYITLREGSLRVIHNIYETAASHRTHASAWKF